MIYLISSIIAVLLCTISWKIYITNAYILYKWFQSLIFIKLSMLQHFFCLVVRDWWFYIIYIFYLGIDRKMRCVSIFWFETNFLRYFTVMKYIVHWLFTIVPFITTYLNLRCLLFKRKFIWFFSSRNVLTSTKSFKHII